MVCFDLSGTHNTIANVLAFGLISPTLIATLWDVTDRECDRFAQSVFTSLKLDDSKKPSSAKISVVQAVASAREACKLKYLTGAAPVIYGIPFYL
jgi:separase